MISRPTSSPTAVSRLARPDPARRRPRSARLASAMATSSPSQSPSAETLPPVRPILASPSVTNQINSRSNHNQEKRNQAKTPDHYTGHGGRLAVSAQNQPRTLERFNICVPSESSPRRSSPAVRSSSDPPWPGSASVHPLGQPSRFTPPL